MTTTSDTTATISARALVVPKVGDIVNGEIVIWVARDGSGFETALCAHAHQHPIAMFTFRCDDCGRVIH